MWLPTAVVTVSETVCAPPVVYPWLGCCSMLEAPSPKSQAQDVIAEKPGMDSSVNATVKGTTPDTESEEKAAVGMAGVSVSTV